MKEKFAIKPTIYYKVFFPFKRADTKNLQELVDHRPILRLVPVPLVLILNLSLQNRSHLNLLHTNLTKVVNPATRKNQLTKIIMTEFTNAMSPSLLPLMSTREKPPLLQLM